MAYKGKGHGARIKDKLRKIWKKPAGARTTNFGTSVGGVTGGTGEPGTTGNYPFKKKPKRRGRPDGR